MTIGQSLLPEFDNAMADTKPWSLIKSGETDFTLLKIAIIRTWVINHIIRYRGHLCGCLRVIDLPVPACTVDRPMNRDGVSS